MKKKGLRVPEYLAGVVGRVVCTGRYEPVDGSDWAVEVTDGRDLPEFYKVSVELIAVEYDLLTKFTKRR